MTRITRLISLFIALGLFSSVWSSVAMSEVVLRAITYAPVNKVEDSMVMFRRWIELVNTAGKGELRIDLIGGPEVFPVRDQINATSKGLADIVMTFSVHTAQVPMIDITGVSDVSMAEERKNGFFDLLDKAHEKINIKVIGRTATDSGFYIFSRVPIRKLADFKGLKIRSHSGYDPLFKAVGAVPIGMSISEIYGALERGVVDAAPYPLYVYDMGLQEVAKYVLADAFWTSHTTWTFMNLKKYRSLSPKLQKILLDAQLQIEKEMPKTVAALKAKERSRLEAAGMTFTHLPPEEAKKWKELANKTRFDAFARKAPAAEVEKIKSMIVRN